MNNNKSILLLLITSLLFSLSSCSKDNDTTGPVATYAVQGKIVDDKGNSIEGVIVTASRNKFTRTDTTSAEGTYSIDGLSNGEYTLTPNKLGYVFNPDNLKITIKDADLAVQTITVSFEGFTISGKIVDSTGAGIHDVNLILRQNSIEFSDTTKSNGTYSFSGIPNGDYKLEPSEIGYVFEPETWEITINNANLTISDIIAVYKEYTISGTVTGASYVTITLSGDKSDSQIVDNDGGTYLFNVGHGGTYTVTPFKAEFSFSPSYYIFNNVTSDMTQDFFEFNEILMVTLPEGTFLMGDLVGDGEPYSYREIPVHNVTLSAFEMSIYEITQGQYEEIMGINPSYFGPQDELPVESVSSEDAILFCNQLSEKVGLEKCYTGSMCDFSKNGFRLPTEAEWEYACRAGTETKYFTGNSVSDLERAGWFDENSSSQSHPVGQKEPNAWGLYDMHGNVWEWCNDWAGGNYSESPSTNPVGPSSGNQRVARGGSWRYGASRCRSSGRSSDGYGHNNLGFRIVRRP